MNKITPQLTLLFYDYPQVFIGRDKIGTQLVCMATSENEDGPVYTCIQISETQKNSLIQGKIDLRSVYATPEIDTFFEAFPSNKSEEIKWTRKTGQEFKEYPAINEEAGYERTQTE